MHVTIITNSFDNRNYLVSSEIEFGKIYKILSEYITDGDSLFSLLKKTAKRTKYLNKFGINYNEKQWIFIWVSLTNKIIPDAHLKLLEYTPIEI